MGVLVIVVWVRTFSPTMSFQKDLASPFLIDSDSEALGTSGGSKDTLGCRRVWQAQQNRSIVLCSATDWESAGIICKNVIIFMGICKSK
jgi:hypothetical protein